MCVCNDYTVLKKSWEHFVRKSQNTRKPLFGKVVESGQPDFYKFRNSIPNLIITIDYYY